jgi:hypothetical protein
MLFCRCSLSPYRCEPFLRSASLGQGAVLDRRVFSLPQSFLFSTLRSKLYDRIQNSNYNKVNFLEHFIIIFVYVLYYVLLLR